MCSFLAKKESQGSDVDINIRPHEPHAHSLIPDSLKTPYFPPPFCSPFAQQLLWKHQAYKQTLQHEKHKWNYNPHNLQLLGDVFFHLPWITHSRTMSCSFQFLHTVLAALCSRIMTFAVSHVWLTFAMCTSTKDRIAKQRIKSLLDSLQCFSSAKVQCYYLIYLKIPSTRSCKTKLLSHSQWW